MVYDAERTSPDGHLDALRAIESMSPEDHLVALRALELSTPPPAGVVRMADVDPVEVEWVWHPYIPRGKLTLLEGDPGQGSRGSPSALPPPCLSVTDCRARTRQLFLVAFS